MESDDGDGAPDFAEFLAGTDPRDESLRPPEVSIDDLLASPAPDAPAIVENVLPTANAGTDQEANPGNNVSLDGSLSVDSDCQAIILGGSNSCCAVSYTILRVKKIYAVVHHVVSP
jgi:hypothetical protein